MTDMQAYRERLRQRYLEALATNDYVTLSKTGDAIDLLNAIEETEEKQ